MIHDVAKVLSIEKLTDGIYSMWLETAAADDARCGQFVMLYPKDGSTLLGRPISICEAASGKLRLVFRVCGKGTGEFSLCRPGDELKILGPCGNGYDTALCNGTAYLVGGGIGLPPLLQLGRDLKEQGKSFRYVLGYRDSNTFLLEEFRELAGEADVLIATDDGSLGVKGTVMDAIEDSGEKPGTVFACGPMPMLRALKGYAAGAGINAYISLEERMGCGVGACLGCVCKPSASRREKAGASGKMRICVEGPVFEAGDVDI